MTDETKMALSKLNHACDLAVRQAPPGKAIEMANELAVAYNQVLTTLNDCPCKDNGSEGAPQPRPDDLPG